MVEPFSSPFHLYCFSSLMVVIMMSRIFFLYLSSIFSERRRWIRSVASLKCSFSWSNWSKWCQGFSFYISVPSFLERRNCIRSVTSLKCWFSSLMDEWYRSSSWHKIKETKRNLKVLVITNHCMLMYYICVTISSKR